MKTKYHIVETVLKSNWQNWRNIRNIDTLYTQIRDRPFVWLGTCTLIKSGVDLSLLLVIWCGHVSNFHMWIKCKHSHIKPHNDVMVSVLLSSAVDRGLEPRSGQSKDNKIGTCYFFAMHAALWRKSKGWLARNQDNVSEWIDMSTRGLLFRWASTTKIQLSVLV